MKHSQTPLLRSAVLAVLCAGAISTSSPVSAQTPAPGHRVFGGQAGPQTQMVDSNGIVDQVWTSAFDSSFATYADRNGTLLRVIVTDPFPVGGTAGGLQRVALDGTVLWDFRYDDLGRLSHHDIAELPNGNVLIVAWEEKTTGEAIAAGRNPSLINGTFRPDHIIEVQQTGLTTGEIVWEWYAWDHLVQDFDPTRDNFGVVADHPELIDINFPVTVPFQGDWNHINGIDYDAVYDRIILSSNEQSEIWVIDHSTTTEEAAGHTGGQWGRGGDLLYRWGNPQAYGAGTEADRVFRTQHAPRVVPEGYPGAGNFMVFLNNAPDQVNRSIVYELVPPLDGTGAFILDPSGVYGPEGPVWTYSDPDFYSFIISSAERLPNGNTLICSGIEGRVFEVDSAGQTVVDFTLPSDTIFNAHYVDRWLWSDSLTLSASQGGSAGLELIAGTAFAGMDYLLLGTSSGAVPGVDIGGINIPLNPDPLTQLARQQPNSAIFENSSGTLDSLGRATAAFNLPAGSPLSAGDMTHFAYVIFDSGTPVFASNAVLVSIEE